MQLPTLEPLREHGAFEERLLTAAKRLMASSESPAPDDLRPEQVGVFEDFAEYLIDVATRPEADLQSPMGRIILPPRIGKTVIARSIAQNAGLTTVFIVPTKILVEQAAREFRRTLPEGQVGVFYGEAKELVVGGVNVTTYQILQNHFKAHGKLPWQIAMAALIFADEAHHAMTASRMEMLRKGFDFRAIRIALTATPDYDQDRHLSRYFPDLIHEMTVTEAMQLKLVADVRFWLAEVDEHASVAVVAGDFQPEQLGRIMSAAPYFEAVRYYRYDPEHRNLAGLICCASRQQAYDLYAYLYAGAPEGAPKPRLIVTETDGDSRRCALRDFESGRIDTLITVGVLIEGWSSERCKLLIDLSPSRSFVRAKQKFFRPLTKWGDHEAHIVMIMPSNLPHYPILPLDLFGDPSGEYVAGDLLTAARPQQKPTVLASIPKRKRTPIEKVELVTRIVLTERFEPPKLDPRKEQDIRAVIGSLPGYHPETDLGGIQKFRWFFFRHPLFTGRGGHLLRHLGVRLDRESFIAFMARLYPDSAARRFMQMHSVESTDDDCGADRAYLLTQLTECDPSTPGTHCSEGFSMGWRAALGAAAGTPETTPPDLLDRLKILRLVFDQILPTLRPIERFVLGHPLELSDHLETFEDYGDTFGLSRERIRQILSVAQVKIRRQVSMRCGLRWDEIL